MGNLHSRKAALFVRNRNLLPISKPALMEVVFGKHNFYRVIIHTEACRRYYSVEFREKLRSEPTEFEIMFDNAIASEMISVITGLK